MRVQVLLGAKSLSGPDRSDMRYFVGLEKLVLVKVERMSENELVPS